MGWTIRQALLPPCLVPVPWHFISARWQGVTLASAELVGLPQTQCLTVETFSSFPALRSTERGRLSSARLPDIFSSLRSREEGPADGRLAWAKAWCPG